MNEQLAQKHFNLFPNPNSGTFIFQGKLGESYSIVNELGQVINKIQLKNSESFEITGLQSGMYVVVSTTGLERKKIIVVE